MPGEDCLLVRGACAPSTPAAGGGRHDPAGSKRLRRAGGSSSILKGLCPCRPRYAQLPTPISASTSRERFPLRSAFTPSASFLGSLPCYTQGKCSLRSPANSPLIHHYRVSRGGSKIPQEGGEAVGRESRAGGKYPRLRGVFPRA